MTATKAFFICRAPSRTDLFPNRQKNMSILFIFVFPITLPERLHLANNFHGGSSTRRNTRRCWFLTLLMKRIFRSRIFRIRFSRFLARASAQWNYAVFPRTAVSPGDAAGCLSCRFCLLRGKRTGGEFLSSNLWIGGGGPKRTRVAFAW